MRHEEEVELAIDDLRLLHESCIDIGTLRRVVNLVAAIIRHRLLEESLSDSLVDDDEGDLGGLEALRLLLRVQAILKGNDLVKLGQLLVNDLLPH